MKKANVMKRKHKIHFEAFMDLDGTVKSTISKGPDSMVTEEDVLKFCEQVMEQADHFKETAFIWPEIFGE